MIGDSKMDQKQIKGLTHGEVLQRQQRGEVNRQQKTISKS